MTKATAGTSASAPASASHTATASPKAIGQAKAKSSAKKTAAARARNRRRALLTVPAGWKLTFDPSFSGTQLSTGTWATCYDWATSPSVGCTNNPTKEKEWYVPSQVNVERRHPEPGGEAGDDPGASSSGAAKTYTCRSGMVTSKPGFNFTYGLIQISAKLPYGPGLWPALGSRPPTTSGRRSSTSWSTGTASRSTKVYDHTVGKKYLGGPVPTPANLSAGFHTYSLLWTKDRVTWYLDGAQVFTTTSYVPQQAMYFIANVADDSTAAGACTGTMQIQSVKVWQP